MKFTNDNSDDATLGELGSRIARYRLDRNLTQAELAQEAGVSMRTLQRIEGGESTHVSNLIRILRTLRLLENLESLVPEPAMSPIQQMKMQGKQRSRASSRTRKPEKKAPWSWGDEE